MNQRMGHKLPKRWMRNGGLNGTVMWCGRRMEKINRNYHVRNEVLKTRQGGENNLKQ
jgi:hypothetical protein